MEYVNKAIQIPTRAYSSTWTAAASPFVSLVASIFCCCSGPISSYSCSAAADLHLLLLAISNRQKPRSFAVESSNNLCGRRRLEVCPNRPVFQPYSSSRQLKFCSLWVGNSESARVGPLMTPTQEEAKKKMRAWTSQQRRCAQPEAMAEEEASYLDTLRLKKKRRTVNNWSGRDGGMITRQWGMGTQADTPPVAPSLIQIHPP
ncbi:hypothetical protein DdX_01248 [Ditylenchus destructor]|uniref:Uncharacterized protein n=1 Tax=Ditylenchus destructor TaxID=166010 RepID=A0AAD4NIG4_9BILA|nr:hypothetical protein DdX_01248 [Ditylenchus destructor]